MAMVYDEARSMTILIGGMNAERAMNGKTWGWDGTTWRELSATGPSPRIGSGIAYDAARRDVVSLAARARVSRTPGHLALEWSRLA